MPANVSEGRQLLSRGLRISPGSIAEFEGLNEERLDEIILAAIDTSSTGEEFLSKAVQELAMIRRRQGEADLFQRIGELVSERARGQWSHSEDVRAHIRHRQREQANGEPGDPEPSLTTPEATPMNNQTDDFIALGREVSRLGAKVNILLAVGGTSALAIIGGAIGLWQAIGNVETRLTRELGQVEIRIVQQIADVRSEVGEIRGRLSVLGPSEPAPPR
jgi:hypothetical protein